MITRIVFGILFLFAFYKLIDVLEQIARRL